MGIGQKFACRQAVWWGKMCSLHCSSEWGSVSGGKGDYLSVLFHVNNWNNSLNKWIAAFLVIHSYVFIFFLSFFFMVLNPVIGKYSQLPGSGTDFKEVFNKPQCWAITSQVTRLEVGHRLTFFLTPPEHTHTPHFLVHDWARVVPTALEMSLTQSIETINVWITLIWWWMYVCSCLGVSSQG